jgi:hypothetical protein
MTNKLVVIINSLKILKLKKILLYEMKFLVPNYSCLQNPCLGGYRPHILILSVLCPQLNLLNMYVEKLTEGCTNRLTEGRRFCRLCEGTKCFYVIPSYFYINISQTSHYRTVVGAEKDSKLITF